MTNSKSKIVTIAGNRPELIKLSEVVKILGKRYHNIFVYTGQHFSKNMSDDFFHELGIEIDYNLNCSTSDVDILSEDIKECLLRLSPDYVIVYGDTNSSLAGAIAAKKINCKLLHLEAGLRCFDLTMTEERNRSKIDSLADHLLAPTELNKVFLKFEGIPENKIFVTGNLIVDVCKKYSSQFTLEKFERLPIDYILLTLHRQENVDNPKKLQQFAKLLACLKYTVVFPIHPRTKNNLNKYNIQLPSNVITIDPVGYKQFLTLLNYSILVMTDSGGVQEEAAVLKKHCITLRKSTERQETLLVKANRLFYPFGDDDFQLDYINNIIEEMLVEKQFVNPYGEDVTIKTVKTIEKIIENELKNYITIEKN